MPSFSEILAIALPSLVSGVGVSRVLDSIWNRHKIRVDAVDRLSDTTQDLVEAIRKDAREQMELARLDVTAARRDALEARNEASAARAEATAARREAMEAVATVRRLTLAILSPYATLEGLRDMVNGPNGYGGSEIT